MAQIIEKNGLDINSKRPKRFKDSIFILSVLGPISVHFLIFSIFPVIFSLVISFYDWPLLGTPRFIGLANWQQLFSDPIVWNSIMVTFKFSLFYILPAITIGLILALLINTKLNGVGLFKSAFFLPVITSGVILAGIWNWIFISEKGGIVNSILGVFGIPPQMFFDERLAIVTIALLSVYRISGLLMVYFYAGLKGISEDLYEAAKIDGCQWWQSFWKITLPLLKPTMLYVVIITTIGSMQVFDSVYILTKGGPNYATNTIVYNIYKEGFFDLNMGYACSTAYILFAIIFVLTMIQYKVLNKDLSYD